MAAQWYAIKRNSDNKIISYTSDDAQGFNSISASFSKVGPYADQVAAQAANEPVTPLTEDPAISALRVKSPAAWTTADIATWLQKKG